MRFSTITILQCTIALFSIVLLSCYHETSSSLSSLSWGVHAFSVTSFNSPRPQPCHRRRHRRIHPTPVSVSRNPFVSSSSGMMVLQASSSSSSSSTTTASTTTTTSSSSVSFRIRKINFSELDQVSKIILVSFYKKEYQQDIWKHFCTMQELNRLQSNFPYTDPHHYMYAAVVEEEPTPPSPSARRTLQNNNNNRNHKKPIIVGFVDIDARPPKQSRTDPPRPYLSDLCIHPQYRRQGIARALIQQCEETVQQLFQKDELYIRVEQDNEAARSMYDDLGYQHQVHDIFGVRDTTMLLHRSFITKEKEKEETKNPSSSPDENSTTGSCDTKESNTSTHSSSSRSSSSSSQDETVVKADEEEETDMSVPTGSTNGTVPVLDYVV